MGFGVEQTVDVEIEMFQVLLDPTHRVCQGSSQSKRERERNRERESILAQERE